MEWKQNYYEELIQKLDGFTRKFYINKLIRGSLYFVGLMTLVFVIFNVLEGQFYFGKDVRKFFFFTFIGASAFSAFKWIATPLMSYFNLGKLISHEEAAVIIGKHFSNVEDKLLNVLQLKSQSVNYTDRSLIEASIQQKANDLKPVPILSAIDYNKNRKYIRFALIPLSLLMGIFVIAPSMIKDSTKRIIQNDQEFKKAAPFSFELSEKELLVPQGDDYKLSIDITGSALPNEVFIEIDQLQYRLKKENSSQFTYVFNNVQQAQNFKLVSGDISSENYLLKVAMNPVLSSLRARIDYPDYTGVKDESIENSGDMTVPAGTKILWTMDAQHTDGMYYRVGNQSSKQPLHQSAESSFQFSYKAMKDEPYVLFLKNKYFEKFDSLRYSIAVIPDQYPQINVQNFEDSTDASIIYLSGDASDDYGLSDLRLNYTVSAKDGKISKTNAVKVDLQKNKSSVFRHILDLNEIGILPGEKISYYFEVWDNDGVNGAKSTKSSILDKKLASPEELAKEEDKNNEEIKDELEDALSEAQKLQEKIDQFREKIREKKDIEWQNKKDLERLMDQQNELLNQFENAKKKFNENLNKQEQFSNPDEKLLNKQEQLKNLFNETMQNEIKDLMDKIQQLMQELNKDKALEMSEQMKDKSEDFKKEMERLKELFKQLEVEKNIKDQIEKLRELANRQDEVKEKTEKKEHSPEELKKMQEDINKKLEELKKKQEDIMKKNAELEKSNKVADQKKNMEDAKKKTDGAKDKLDKKDNDGASKDQKDGAEKMNEMADQMEKEMESGDQEQQEEDIKVLRQLLENLVTVSFEQEALTADFSKTDNQTNRFTNLIKEESRLKGNFKIIQDTLEALSKRVVEIQSFVAEKVSEINSNFKTSIELLEQRNNRDASVNQGRIMKNLNDLAVMLSETMNKKQKDCNSNCNKPGNKACKKPGKGAKPGKKGKVPSDKIAEGQKNLTEEMKKMHDQIKGKSGQGGSSKEFAEMAAKQAQLRKMLEDLQKEKKEQGNGSSELQKAIDDMNKNEKQLVNKQLDNETLRRNQEITTRLLESDRAEREREFKEERQSETGTKIARKFPPGLEEYLKQRQAEVEWYQQVSPDLRPFYKKLVENYFHGMKKQG
ncbi:MAG: DUF4175 domain-containing protein [Saprospiraceae bacterium]|nr:DUF4175 domain-containing protein [Saprospiraceae bacterium]